MKTFTTSFALLLILITSQTKAQGPTMGFQSGGLYTVLSYDGESQSGAGYYFGVSGIFPIAKKWTIRPEVNLQRRSFKMNYNESYSGPDYTYEEDYTSKYNYQFIDLPLIVQYQANDQFGFYCGPQYGIAVGAEYSEEYTAMSKELDTGDAYEEEGSYSEDRTYVDDKEISLLVGMNYTFDFGLAVDFRAQRSVIAAYYGEVDSDLSWANFQLGLRYNLPLNK